jgi:hypothetical protein
MCLIYELLLDVSGKRHVVLLDGPGYHWFVLLLDVSGFQRSLMLQDMFGLKRSVVLLDRGIPRILPGGMHIFG